MHQGIPLVPDTTYVFIDALYIKEFKNVEDSVLESTSLTDWRALVFPYCGDPYAVFTADTPYFDLARIIYFSEPEATAYGLQQFCSDTGMILLIAEAIFLSVVAEFDIEALIDSIEEMAEHTSWTALREKYPSQLFYFTTAEIDLAYAGGGSFLITEGSSS